MKRRVIYVAGPITHGDSYLNVAEAIDAAETLYEMGWAPLVPHLGYLWHMMYPKSYEDWMDYDFHLLNRCDALVRLPGESSGSDREVAFAEELGIPVYLGVESVPNVVISGHDASR